MSEEITYARVGGPPADWKGLEVRDLDTGELRTDVVEVNSAEGWCVIYRLDQWQPWMDQIPQERIEGRFRIERRS